MYLDCFVFIACPGKWNEAEKRVAKALHISWSQSMNEGENDTVLMNLNDNIAKHQQTQLGGSNHIDDVVQ